MRLTPNLKAVGLFALFLAVAAPAGPSIYRIVAGTGLSGGGTGGSVTISAGTELAGLAGLSSTGIVARTGSGSYTPRTLTAGSGISISNGDGVSGNPTITATGGSTVRIPVMLCNAGIGQPVATTWTANQYVGYLGLQGTLSTSVPQTAAWSSPFAGTLRNFRLRVPNQAGSGAPSNLNITIYKGASNCTSFSATSAVIAVASGTYSGADNTNTVSIAADDCVLCRIDTSWTVTSTSVGIVAEFDPS